MSKESVSSLTAAKNDQDEYKKSLDHLIKIFKDIPGGQDIIDKFSEKINNNIIKIEHESESESESEEDETVMTADTVKTRSELITKLANSKNSEIQQIISDNIKNIKKLTYQNETVLVAVTRINFVAGMEIEKQIKDIDYLTKVSDMGYSYYHSLCYYSTKSFIDTVCKIKNKNEFEKKCGHMANTFLNMLLKNANHTGFIKFCEILDRFNLLIYLTTPDTHPLTTDYYSGYSPIAFILQNLGNRIGYSSITYSDMLKMILVQPWFETIVNDVFATIELYESFYLAKTLFDLSSDKIKSMIGSICVLKNKFWNQKCIKKLIASCCVDTPDLLIPRSLNRLFFVIREGDSLILEKLLTSRNFKEEEFRYVTYDQENCFHFAMKHNYKLILQLVQSNHFVIDMLYAKDYGGKNMKDKIIDLIAAGNKDPIIKDILQIFFQKPDYVEDGFEGDSLCNICCAARKNVCLVPCGHTLCSECISRVREFNCPYCNEEIKDIHRFILHI